MDPVRLVREPIDVAGIVDDLRRTAAGAIATFEGTVRHESRDGRTLAALDYYAYDAMAMTQMSEIRSRAIETHGLLDAAIVHRLGRLEPGVASIAVVVVAGHRAEAFEAVRRIVDAVKTDVPIWKKDCWTDGTETWTDPTVPQ